MNNFRRQILMGVFKLSDLLVMIASFMAATAITSYQIDTLTLEQFLQMRIKVVNFILFIGLLVLWHSLFVMFGLYRSRRLGTIKREIIDIVKATSLCTVAIYLLSLLFDMIMITPVFLLSFWTVSTTATILIRIGMRYTLNGIRRSGRNLRYLLIVGTNSRAVHFAGKIESQPELGYVIAGFVDDQWKGNGDLGKHGWKLVSDFKGFTDFIRTHVVDEVLVSLPLKSLYKETSRMINECENQGILVRHLSNIFDTKMANSKAEHFEDESFVSHYNGAMEGWQILAKGLLDRIVSLIFLILLSPLLPFH